MATKAQTEANRRYYWKTKRFKRTYIFKVDTREDPELAAWLDSKKQRAEYIRNALKRDMRGE